MDPAETIAHDNPKGRKITAVEVVDTYDQRHGGRVVIHRRGGKAEFDRLLRQYGGREKDRYVVQGLDADGEVVIDNQGTRGSVRRLNPGWLATLGLAGAATAGGYFLGGMHESTPHKLVKYMRQAEQAIADRDWLTAAEALANAEGVLRPGAAWQDWDLLQSLNQQLPPQFRRDKFLENPEESIQIPGVGLVTWDGATLRRGDTRLAWFDKRGKLQFAAALGGGERGHVIDALREAGVLAPKTLKRRNANPRRTAMAKKRSKKRGKRCPPGKISVRRKGYTRKAFTKKDGTQVKASRVPGSTFCVTDRGAPGKGPKVIPPLEPGKLGGPGYLKKSATERHKILDRCVKREGYRECLGHVQALSVFGKHTFKKTQKDKLVAYRKYLVKKYGGPGSFGRRKNESNPTMSNPTMSNPGMTDLARAIKRGEGIWTDVGYSATGVDPDDPRPGWHFFIGSERTGEILMFGDGLSSEKEATDLAKKLVKESRRTSPLEKSREVSKRLSRMNPEEQRATIRRLTVK